MHPDFEGKTVSIIKGSGEKDAVKCGSAPEWDL